MEARPTKAAGTPAFQKRPKKESIERQVSSADLTNEMSSLRLWRVCGGWSRSITGGEKAKKASKLELAKRGRAGLYLRNDG